MDPLSMIAGALVAGAAAATQEVVSQAVKDAYNGLKSLIIKKFGTKSAIESATRGVEKKPNDKSRQEILEDELASAGAAQDADVLKQAQGLIVLIQQQAPAVAEKYSAMLTGGGTIAQRPRAKSAGAGGVIVEGSNSGSINTGAQTNVNTGGGTHVGGNVTTGRDFVGRDMNVHNYYGERRQEPGQALPNDPRAKKLYDVLNGYAFSLDDLEDIAFTLGVEWDSLVGSAKPGKARAMVSYFAKYDRLNELEQTVRQKRPRLQW